MRTVTPKTLHLAVIIEKDESGYFVGTVPSLRSCYTQAKTLPESDFFLEKNKPAAFKHPFLAKACDWLMFRDILRGKLSIW